MDVKLPETEYPIPKRANKYVSSTKPLYMQYELDEQKLCGMMMKKKIMRVKDNAN